MAHLDPDPVFDNEASYETQDKQRISAPVPIVATPDDHASPSTPTYSTTPAPAPPVFSSPPPRPTECDYSKIPGLTGRKTAERAAAKAMKVWEKSVKNYEKTVKDWEKAIEKNERKKREKAKKEEKNSTTQHYSGRGYAGKKKEWNGRSDD